MTRIIVGLDGSAGSRAALAWALEQARATDAEIEAVLAYSSGVAWIDVGSEYEAPMMQAAKKKAQHQLDQVLTEETPRIRRSQSMVSWSWALPPTSSSRGLVARISSSSALAAEVASQACCSDP